MIRSLQLAGAGAPMGGEELDAAYRWPDGRWVRANFAVSADGAVEVGGRSGPLGGPDDRTVFAALRAAADVVLVGSGTVRAEGYGGVQLDGADRARRAARGQAPAVPIAVVTSRAELAPDARLFRASAAPGAAPAIVLTCAAAPAPAIAALRAVAEVVVCGDREVDDGLVLDALTARGLRRVLCEGGPTVLGRLVRAGLLDELCLTVAPVLAGPGRAGLFGSEAWPATVAMRRTQVLGSDDGTLFLRFDLEGPRDR